ncbi:MAG: OmpA family protein [Rhodospirillales bacterium]|nr:OmpA family protein [Rhodospirillales bacterium]MCW9001817.1 OmpA family protein [Rhodospirillales bacterium]
MVTKMFAMKKKGGAQRRVPTAWFVAFLAPAALAGCSSVPDAVNPVEWYRSVSDALSGEEKGAAPEGAAETQTPQDATASYPSVRETPERPKAVSEAERQEIASGLVADRQRARYSSDVVRRQGDPVSPLRGDTAPASTSASAPAPSTIASNEPPPPKASAVTPVTSEPTRVAQAPRPAPAPVTRSTPVSSESVRETYRQQLAQRLSNAPKQEQPQISGTLRSLDAQDDGVFETIVVSSGGVETNEAVYDESRRLSPSPVSAPTSRVVSTSVENGTARSLAEYDGRAAAHSYKVATIQFDIGDADLTALDRDILAKVAALHRERGGVVRVVGHASSRTRDMDIVRHKLVNLQVSVERADRVARELSRLGVKADALYVGASADVAPVYYEVMPAGEAGNRRAEIFIDY